MTGKQHLLPIKALPHLNQLMSKPLNDHLYEFIYKNRYGLEERVSHPYENSWPSTEDCTVGELPLYKGMELAFHFDFGDDWRFQLVVETLTDNDGRYSKTTLLEQHGTPPKQYRDWDDE